MNKAKRKTGPARRLRRAKSPSAGKEAMGLAVNGMASFAGAVVGVVGGTATRRALHRMLGLRPGDAPEAAPPAAAASGPSSGGDGFAVGGVGSGETFRFDVACLKPGATRDFLRARYPGQKPQFAIAHETGIPADTVRKAMAWQGASELSGPHLMRMVSVFGPPFLAAVLDPVPRWVSEWMEGRDG